MQIGISCVLGKPLESSDVRCYYWVFWWRYWEGCSGRLAPLTSAALISEAMHHRTLHGLSLRCHRYLCAVSRRSTGFLQIHHVQLATPSIAREDTVMAANGSPERTRRRSGMYRRESNMSEYASHLPAEHIRKTHDVTALIYDAEPPASWKTSIWRRTR